MNTPQCYAIRTLPILLALKGVVFIVVHLRVPCSCGKKQLFVRNILQMETICVLFEVGTEYLYIK
jgi:hypothetical protein